MDKVFALLLYKTLENYLDNTLNHHQNITDHITRVCQTLQCLWEAKLLCNPKKCEFHKSKIEFLGVDISKGGFEMDNKKTSVVMDWESLTSVHMVQQFIGFINFYQRWIPGFSDIAHPLHDLFQKNQPWQWTENKPTAFEILKWCISQSPVLVHTDPDSQFCMEPDASNYAYGAVLSQKQTDSWRHPIGFMSKSMNLAERNYGIPDKEALAIVKGLQNW
jgi:hypothetical protein